MGVSRLAVDKTTVHRGWDTCAIASDGRIMFQAWNYEKPDRFQQGGKAIALPELHDRKLVACGTRFVFLGHPWEDGTPATAIVLDGAKRREVQIPRKGHERHFLAGWLADDDRLAIVASDGFHVVHGVAITEVALAARVKQAPILKVLQLTRHVGKGHSDLSLQSVMRAGDRLFAIASAGYRYHALLELAPKGKSFGSRIVAHMKADTAVFSSGGAHAVFYERNRPAVIVGLDGSKLATVTPAVPKGGYLTLVAAAPGRLGFSGDKAVHVVDTPPWPGGATGELADVPASAAIADLPVDHAAACSPEPTSYRGKPRPPVAFGAVIGWSLNADPAKKKPAITHAIVTDLIVNFFATTDRKLRLLFNFDLGAIERVTTDGDRMTITTPSGTTVLRTTPAFAAALAGAVKARRRRR